MFIREVSGDSEFVDADLIEEYSLFEKYKYLANLRKQLKERFRKEYLSQLIEFNKSKKGKLSKREIVIVQVDQRKRQLWPLGKVLEIIKGADGEERLARIQVGKNVIVRPFQRIYKLEVGHKNACDETEKGNKDNNLFENKKGLEAEPASKTVVTRKGRKIKKPTKLNL